MKLKQRCLFGMQVSRIAYRGDVHGVFAAIILGLVAFATYNPDRLMSIAVGYSDRTEEPVYRTVRG